MGTNEELENKPSEVSDDRFISECGCTYEIELYMDIKNIVLLDLIMFYRLSDQYEIRSVLHETEVHMGNSSPLCTIFHE